MFAQPIFQLWGESFEQKHKPFHKNLPMVFRHVGRSSVLYRHRHTFSNHCKKAIRFGNRFDYVAVVIGLYSASISHSICNQENRKYRIHQNLSTPFVACFNLYHIWKQLLSYTAWPNFSRLRDNLSVCNGCGAWKQSWQNWKTRRICADQSNCKHDLLNHHNVDLVLRELHV